MKYKCYVVWGEKSSVAEMGEDAISEYEFDTKAELDAFVRGIAEASGWSDSYIADTKSEAMSYVQGVTEDA